MTSKLVLVLMAVVPRVMEHIWNAVLDQAQTRQIWQELERLEQKTSAGGFTDKNRERFDALRAYLNVEVRRALGGRIKMTHVPDTHSAIDIARGAIGPGDAVLVKGSNSIGLAALVEALAGGPSTELGTGKS